LLDKGVGLVGGGERRRGGGGEDQRSNHKSLRSVSSSFPACFLTAVPVCALVLAHLILEQYLYYFQDFQKEINTAAKAQGGHLASFHRPLAVILAAEGIGLGGRCFCWGKWAGFARGGVRRGRISDRIIGAHFQPCQGQML
jgi:hypothetical protein